MSGYTIGEITGWLLLAGALGFAFGWLVRELQHRAVQMAPDDAEPASVTSSTEGHEPRSAGNAPAKKAVATTTATKSPATKTATKKAPATKAATKKAPATKAPATKAPATKAPAKKAPAKKAPTKKTAAKKAPAKKSEASMIPHPPPSS